MPVLMLGTCTFRAIHWVSDQQEVPGTWFQALTEQFCNSLNGKAVCLPADWNKGRSIFQQSYLIRVLIVNRRCVAGASFSAGEKKGSCFFWLWLSELPKTVINNENQTLCIHNVILKNKQNRNKNKQKRKPRDHEDLILNTEWELRTRCSCLLQQKFCFLVREYVFLMVALWFMWFVNLRETGQIRVACATQSSYAIPLIIMN